MPKEYSIRDQCTVIIVTHATKTLPELGRKDTLVYPGAPKTELLSKVVTNIVEFTGLSNVLIALDHKVDCQISLQYLNNLRQYCDANPCRLFISPSALSMPSQLTATQVFVDALKAVQTDYFLLWEHDHMFINSIDWSILDSAFCNKVEMVRFNRRANIAVSGSVPETLMRSAFSHNLCQTNYYCNGPFIAATQWCRDLYSKCLRFIPHWNGCFGGFIEGPINQYMLKQELNLSSEEFCREFPIYLYGAMGASPIVSHFGDFPGRKARMWRAMSRYLKSKMSFLRSN